MPDSPAGLFSDRDRKMIQNVALVNNILLEKFCEFMNNILILRSIISVLMGEYKSEFERELL
jgi:hypothetical protein